MSAFSREALEAIAKWSEIFAAGFAMLAALSGVAYLLSTKPLRKIEAHESLVQQQKTAEAQAAAAKAQRELLELKQKLADRELTDAQLDKVAESLKSFAGQEFDMIPFWDNKESVAIGNRMVLALQKAHWIFVKAEYQGAILGGLVGIKVTIDPASDAKSKKAANSLVSILSKQGLTAVLNEEGLITPRANKIQIEVGTKG